MLQHRLDTAKTESHGILAESISPKPRLAEAYNRYFEGKLANTSELVKQAYRLRYQVYCVENAFEDPAENPGELETDEFDSRSIHTLLYHRTTNQVAGTVRLVLADPKNLAKSLPIFDVCNHPLLWNPVRLPPARMAEISRFAISKQFRQSRGDGRYPDIRSGETRRSGKDRRQMAALTAGESSPQTVDNRRSSRDRRSGLDRRVIPHMTLGLMNGIVRMSVENDITHWCAVMEPALLRLLARMGIHFEPVGPLVEYHGERQPVYAEAGRLLARIWREQPEVWEVITEAGSLWPLSKAA